MTSARSGQAFFSEASSVNYALPKERERERMDVRDPSTARDLASGKRAQSAPGAVRVGVSHPGPRLGVQITFRQCHWNEPGYR